MLGQSDALKQSRMFAEHFFHQPKRDFNSLSIFNKEVDENTKMIVEIYIEALEGFIAKKSNNFAIELVKVITANKDKISAAYDELNSKHIFNATEYMFMTNFHLNLKWLWIGVNYNNVDPNFSSCNSNISEYNSLLAKLKEYIGDSK